MVTSVPEMFLMVSTHDVKRFGLDKVKDFCVSNSVYDSMLKTFKELEPDKLFDQKYFQYGNKNFSGHVLSFEQFMNHHEKILEPVFKPTEFYFRKPFALFARTEENSFVVNFPRHELISDYFLAPTYVLKEPRKLHEPKLHHSDVRVEIVKSANISEFELDCLCAKNDSKRVGLFFEDILVYNTFFEKPVPQLKLEFTDSEYMNLILDDIWVCNIFFDMHNRWRNHMVFCFGDILVYNTFFDMITHLSCPKQAEKGTGKKKGYNDQSINDESLGKLEMQQSNLGNCPAASFDIGAVRGSYLSNQKELSNKLDFHGNLTHQGLTVNWNHVQSFSGERVMGSTSQVNLCLLCLNFSEFVTSQSYLWRPGEHAKEYQGDLSHLFVSPFIPQTLKQIESLILCLQGSIPFQPEKHPRSVLAGGEENLKLEGVRGQTQTRSESGETNTENWAVVWTGHLVSNKTLLGKNFISIWGKRDREGFEETGQARIMGNQIVMAEQQNDCGQRKDIWRRVENVAKMSNCATKNSRTNSIKGGRENVETR
ncbi:hypothetical protein YC2023_010649 [Brassica napus]